MVNIIKKTIALSLILSNHLVFADKIVIIGEPIALTLKDRLYIPPEGFTGSNDYNFVLINTKKTVCYQEKQANLAGLNSISINVVIKDRIAPWTCYPYDESYFTVTP